MRLLLRHRILLHARSDLQRIENKTEKAFSLHELQTLQLYYHSNVLLKGIQDWNSIAQFLIDRATTTATQPLC